MHFSAFTDTEIWELFLLGDDKVLEFIYRKNYKRLYAYGSKITANNDLVKDCIQDVFVKLHMNRANLNSTTNINSYLIISLKNKLYDELSKSSKVVETDLSFALTILDSELPQFLESDDDLILKKRLTEAIQQLSPNQQEAIYLRYFQELDYGQIGEILSINYQSAKNLISRSLIKLRENVTQLLKAKIR